MYSLPVSFDVEAVGVVRSVSVQATILQLNPDGVTSFERRDSARPHAESGNQQRGNSKPLELRSQRYATTSNWLIERNTW
jgi:hypothetical protein